MNGNIARVADGGGICDSSTLTLSGSSVYGNTAAFGAGLYDNDGTESVIRSTVTRNTASDQGGGIYDVNGGTMTLTRLPRWRTTPRMAARAAARASTTPAARDPRPVLGSQKQPGQLRSIQQCPGMLRLNSSFPVVSSRYLDGSV